LAAWAFINFVLATISVLFLLCFKKNDGKKYWIFGHLSQFWGKWISWGLGVKVEAEGLENIDPKKRYVIVANHQSSLDPILIMKVFSLALVVITKEEFKKVFLLGWGLIRSGVIFVKRGDRESMVIVVRQAVKLLSNSLLTLYMFPSGTRKIDYFKYTGAFRIAILMGFDIVPVTFVNTAEVWPANTCMGINRNIKVKMIIGKPISTDYFNREINDMNEVYALRDRTQEEVYRHIR